MYTVVIRKCKVTLFNAQTAVTFGCGDLAPPSPLAFAGREAPSHQCIIVDFSKILLKIRSNYTYRLSDAWVSKY